MRSWPPAPTMGQTRKGPCPVLSLPTLPGLRVLEVRALSSGERALRLRPLQALAPS